MPNNWLEEKHPVWKKWVDTWKRNEMLLRGGRMVIEKELRRYPWERPDREGDLPFKSRINNAVYLNFGEMYLTTMSGHLLREAPRFDEDLSFGTLGTVKRTRNQTPSLAEKIAFNVDGVGNDGSQWDNYWMAAWRRAGATGHRWMFTEAPIVGSESEADQLFFGRRPWMVEYSPIVVTNWQWKNGVLQWAIIRTRVRRPIVDAQGSFSGNAATKGYLLLVREGVTDLGGEFREGGWWLFDKDRELIAGPAGHGNWDMTVGEIPMCPLFYMRDEGRDSDDEFDAEPAMSRPGITELNNASVSYMNLSSAADYDAWDSASGLVYLVNVGPDGWELATEKYLDGSKLIPLRGVESMGTGAGQSPQVVDSAAGAVSSVVFETRLERKLKEVRTVAMNEATLSPDASGLSRQMGFVEGKSPRLTSYASELEQAQNTSLMFLELRAGNANPKGVVVWTRNFDLLDTIQSIKDVFELEKLAGIGSPTMRKKAMRRAVVARGIASSDADLATIENEYGESSDLVDAAKKQGLINAAKPPSDTPTRGPNQDSGGSQDLTE